MRHGITVTTITVSGYRLRDLYRIHFREAIIPVHEERKSSLIKILSTAIHMCIITYRYEFKYMQLFNNNEAIVDVRVTFCHHRGRKVLACLFIRNINLSWNGRLLNCIIYIYIYIYIYISLSLPLSLRLSPLTSR